MRPQLEARDEEQKYKENKFLVVSRVQPSAKRDHRAQHRPHSVY